MAALADASRPRGAGGDQSRTLEINARLTNGFTDAELDVVSRWLTGFQTKFPKGEDQ